MPKITKIKPDSIIEIGEYRLPPTTKDKPTVYHRAHISGMSYSVNPISHKVDRVGLSISRRLEIKKMPLWKRVRYLFDNKPIFIDEKITLLGDVIKTFKRKNKSDIKGV